MNHSIFDQYVIDNPSGLDDQLVLAIFLSLQSEFNLFNNTFSSRVAQTIICMSEGEYRGFGLGAGYARGKIVVELNPRYGRTDNFNAVAQRLDEKLKESFGGRLHLPGQHDYINESVEIPATEESKAHFREFLKRKESNGSGTG